ncbi:dihydropteroate synthase [Candidatus Puniceispirillum sp.]|uniref:dihydropteroate synthase n=1 Tax=Candidatus Puniceispirillum sp. TaxID=2026719 RepID=UPI003F6A3112
MSDYAPISYKAALTLPPFACPTWIRPLVQNIPLDGSLTLAGGWRQFSHVDVVQRDDDNSYAARRMHVDAVISAADDRNKAVAAIEHLTMPRAGFAGLAMNQPHIMGILNVTPDSFSDGGQHNAPVKAIAAGAAMQAAGASIIDIGGESTRPGAEPITRNQELARILPPITGLAKAGALVSVDTRHADVMTRATTAGAGIINDVGGLRADGALGAASDSGAPVIIMHMQGTPESMQNNPHYGFAPVEIYEFLEARISAAIDAGIPRDKIAVDPGFGFGKTLTHNMELMNWFGMLHGLGVPLLLGASRKSTIAKISQDEGAGDRLAGSITLALQGIHEGAQMIRVHDVPETAQAIAVQMALYDAT